MPNGWGLVTWSDHIKLPFYVSLWCQNSTRARSFRPAVDKNVFPQLKLCFFSRKPFLTLFLKRGKTGRGRRPVILLRACTVDVPSSAKPCSLLRWPWAHVPAVQTQPHCWAHTYVQAEPNPIICLALSFFFFFSCFTSVAHIQPPSSVHMSCAARLNKADKRTTVASLSSIFPSREHSPACQLNFSASCSFFFSKLWRDSRYPFCLKENHQSQHGGDASHSIVGTDSGQKNVFVRRVQPIWT